MIFTKLQMINQSFRRAIRQVQNIHKREIIVVESYKLMKDNTLFVANISLNFCSRNFGIGHNRIDKISIIRTIFEKFSTE